jgi:hypothetical protein
MPLYSRDHFNNHSPKPSSFVRCINCFLMRASPRLGIRVTPCGKALQPQLTAMGSRVTISNYSGAGKATQSTSISTNADSRNASTGSSTSTRNSSPHSFTKLSGLDGHSITPPVATRIRRLARRDLQRDFRSFIITTATVVYREVGRIHH